MVPHIDSFPVTVASGLWDDIQVHTLKEKDYQGIDGLRSGWILQVIALLFLINICTIEFKRMQKSYKSLRGRGFVAYIRKNQGQNTETRGVATRGMATMPQSNGIDPTSHKKVRRSVPFFVYKWLLQPRNMIEMIAILSAGIFQVMVTVSMFRARTAHSW